MSTATETIERSEGRQGLASMIRRVKIRNYKSIKNCDVELGPFTILVGRNGSGKSNFLDAIRFVVEGVRGGWDASINTLSPWAGVNDFVDGVEDAEIELHLNLASGEQAAYSIRYGADEWPKCGVLEEKLTIGGADGTTSEHYHVLKGRVVGASTGFMPIAETDHPYLSRAAAVPEFRPAYDALAGSAFYDLNPEAMRSSSMKSTDGALLSRSGSNLARMFGRLELANADLKDRIVSYLRVIAPEVEEVIHRLIVPDRLSQLAIQYAGNPVRQFGVHGTSDGTLRVLGILVAINQLAPDGKPIRVVGIEEPETALHPAAAAALMSALREAATHTQILVTTHGADLLDCYDPEEDALLLATMSEGATRIAPIDEASRSILAKKLDTAGGLLRMDQLEPDLADLERQDASMRPGAADDDHGKA